MTGTWKVNFRFYITARDKCGRFPNSNLLEVLVSVREKFQTKQDTGLMGKKDNNQAQKLEIEMEKKNADRKGRN